MFAVLFLFICISTEKKTLGIKIKIGKYFIHKRKMLNKNFYYKNQTKKNSQFRNYIFKQSN